MVFCQWQGTIDLAIKTSIFKRLIYVEVAFAKSPALHMLIAYAGFHLRVYTLKSNLKISMEQQTTLE